MDILGCYLLVHGITSHRTTYIISHDARVQEAHGDAHGRRLVQALLQDQQPQDVSRLVKVSGGEWAVWKVRIDVILSQRFSWQSSNLYQQGNPKVLLSNPLLEKATNLPRPLRLILHLGRYSSSNPSEGINLAYRT